jgi:hypothetical protein
MNKQQLLTAEKRAAFIAWVPPSALSVMQPFPQNLVHVVGFFWGPDVQYVEHYFYVSRGARTKIARVQTREDHLS